jgi:hypothetical protein
MPYKINTRLPRSHDRRVKYTEEQKKEIKAMHKNGVSQRAIARKTGISRRYISFVLFPNRLEKCKEQYKERRLDGRYYDKERHRLAIAETRHWRKQNLLPADTIARKRKTKK